MLNIPPPSDIDGFPTNPVPYVILGDEIFLLKMWLLRYFSGPLMENNEFLLTVCQGQGEQLKMHSEY